MNVRVLQQSAAAAGHAESPLSELLSRPAFSQEAWHAMNARDNMQIEDEVLHGAAEPEFVYAMMVQGKLVTGVSVVGARQIATEYGGIKGRLIASTEKRGALFVFRQFSPLMIETRTLEELESVDDYYEAVLEVTDIKTGNSIEVRKSESATGNKRDGGKFDRLHYATLAESKAFRNGVLSLIPQGVVKKFKLRCLKVALDAGAFNDTEKAQLKAAVKRLIENPQAPPAGAERTIDQLRDGAMSFATKQGISLDRQALAGLTYAELYALGQTAKDIAAFREAVSTMGLVREATQQEAPAQPRRGRQPKQAAQEQAIQPPDDDAMLRQVEQRGAQPMAIDPADLAERIKQAADYDTLGECGDLIGSISDHVLRAELGKAYEARMAVLDQG